MKTVLMSNAGPRRSGQSDELDFAIKTEMAGLSGSQFGEFIKSRGVGFKIHQRSSHPLNMAPTWFCVDSIDHS